MIIYNNKKLSLAKHNLTINRFCYHERSPCIFPPGFCNENKIVLTPPRGYENGIFRWNQYLIDTRSQPADKCLFQRDVPATSFQVGMKLECADLMDPRLVCVATIAKVVGRLLKVHFDGWEEEYDQWLDCESPDMYPVGWCILVGHKLEGPRVLPKVPVQSKMSSKSSKQRKRTKKKKLDSGESFFLHFLFNFFNCLFTINIIYRKINKPDHSNSTHDC